MKDGQREGAVKCDSEQTGFSKIGNTKESGELQSKSFTNSGESSRRILEERGEKMKKEETNDIIQFFIPILKEVKIDIQNCKIDVTTEKSGNKRGDIWISNTKHGNKDFEKNIIALVEAKHRNCMIGDIDWRDAMKQGKEKSLKQRLNYYIVTNSKTEIRFYNSQTDEEILLDGKFITKMMGEEVLIKIQTQVKKDNSEVIYKSKKEIKHVSENKFRNTLKQLAEIYRSAGLKKGDERIDPTVSFVVLKYISEKETEDRHLDKVIKLWGDFKEISEEKVTGDLKVEFENMVRLIWDEKSRYKNNIYSDFKDLISFPTKLKDEHFKRIYAEFNEYEFHGASFDLFGSIYEEFASQTKKKEFGEFYTRRHITGIVTRLLLRNETNPHELKVCDNACGTGGFLTEAYKTLQTNYSLSGKLNENTIKLLKEKIFYGYDNDDKSVARTKLNMFLVGDGHIHIYENDSLDDWKKDIEYFENNFNYVITNPPMGTYDGDIKIEDFDFTNERRYELMFLEKVVKITDYGGEIAIVLNDGTLETPSRADFRKKMLKHCDISAVISLTKFAFAPYTKEKTYVIFMRKKQKEQIGEIQEFPIWHFIVDYDGYANSDKRYKTKYHDDLPELEEKFDGAIKLASIYLTNKKRFDSEKQSYERKVNKRELSEELTGTKYGFSEMKNINNENFFNLLSEHHLRPYEKKEMPLKEFSENFAKIKIEIKKLVE